MFDQTWISRKDIFMIAIIISGGFITIFNQMVLSPALPSIMKQFQINTNSGQWLTTIFMLVNGIMVPITAYLINRYSTRKLFLFSMLIFTLGTALAAVAPSFSVLMVARILQAIGAGIQLPFGSVVMMMLFPKEKRGIAMGLVGVVVSFAPVIGPTFSGWIVDTWGWQTIFAIIAPMALLDIVFAFFFLRNIGESQNPHLDWSSVVLSTLGFGGLLYGFSSVGSAGWAHPATLLPLCLGSLGVVLFVRRQLHLSEPLLELGVLKNPIFACSTIMVMVVNAGLIVGAVITPIFLQEVLGYSATFSALLLMPGAILMGIMSPISGFLFDRFGPRILSIAGMSIITLGTVLLVTIDENTTYYYMMFAYTLRFLGLAMVNMPINTWGINALDNQLIAHGNAVVNTARQVAGSIGTACLITIMSLVISANPQATLPQATAWGINAAFGGAAVLSGIALLLAIARVGKITPEGKIAHG